MSDHLCPTPECARSHLAGWTDSGVTLTGDGSGPWQSGSPDESYVYEAEAGPGGPGAITYTESYPDGLEAPSVDLRAAEGYLREIHLLHQLVVELSRVYFDQDEEIIRGLHEQLGSGNWPEWCLLERGAWGSRAGADPSAAGPSLVQEGLTGDHEERAF